MFEKGTANIRMRAVPEIIEPGGRLKQLTLIFRIPELRDSYFYFDFISNYLNIQPTQ